MNGAPLAPRAHTTRADTAAQARAHGVALRRLRRLDRRRRVLDPADVAEFALFCLAAFAVGLVLGIAFFG